MGMELGPGFESPEVTPLLIPPTDKVLHEPLLFFSLERTSTYGPADGVHPVNENENNYFMISILCYLIICCECL